MLFEEDLTFFLKKRMKKLGIGLVLLIIPPVILYFMFFYLLYWSSLFQKETGEILIFLILSPLFGLYLTSKALTVPRVRIFGDRITSSAILGKRHISLADIEEVLVVFDVTEPLKVELHMKKDSDSTWSKHVVLGRFLEGDRAKMMKAFTQMGVRTGIRAATFDEKKENLFE
jgi:hypothetical protein